MPLYRNSENTVEFEYEALAKPRSEKELIDLILKCAGERRRLKPSGGGNSFNHIKKTTDVLVDLSRIDAYNRIISVDRVNRTAKIGGAMQVGDAIEALCERGFHFPILGGWYGQTIAGAIATGTHGSSFAHGSLSDYVVELEALLANGTKIHLTDRDQALKAWRVNLGQLGIVTSVTIQIEDPFYLECQTIDHFDDRLGIVSLLERLEAWETGEGGSPWVSMLWLPYFRDNGRTLIRVLSRTSATRPNDRAVAYEERWARRDGNLRKNAAEDSGAVILSKSFIRFPHLYKDIWSNAMANAYLDDHGVVDRSFRLFLYEQFREPTENHWLRLVLSVEVAIDVAQLESALNEIRSLIWQYFDHRIVANYPRFHIRFAAKSDQSWLGTNSGRRTAYFNTYFSAAALRARQIPLAIDIERVLNAHGGRPHWGKFRHLGQDDGFKRTYPQLNLFETYRRSVDPGGVFSDGWEMFRGLDMHTDSSPFPEFSRPDPRNYGKMRFLGGRSSEVGRRASVTHSIDAFAP